MQNKPTLDVVNKAHHYDLLPIAELVALWQENRNSMIGVLAADEVMRRIVRGFSCERLEKPH